LEVLLVAVIPLVIPELFGGGLGFVLELMFVVVITGGGGWARGEVLVRSGGD
jgi:hypothetical protein